MLAFGDFGLLQCAWAATGFRVFGVRTAKPSRRTLNITETPRPRRLKCKTFNVHMRLCAVMRTQHAKHDHLILVATSDEHRKNLISAVRD